MTTVKKLSDELAKLWTVTDLVEVFGKSHVTINTWRRTRDLPTIKLEGRSKAAVRFDPAAVTKWADANKIPMKLTRKQKKRV